MTGASIEFGSTTSSQFAMPSNDKEMNKTMKSNKRLGGSVHLKGRLNSSGGMGGLMNINQVTLAKLKKDGSSR